MVQKTVKDTNTINILSTSLNLRLEKKTMTINTATRMTTHTIIIMTIVIHMTTTTAMTMIAVMTISTVMSINTNMGIAMVTMRICTAYFCTYWRTPLVAWL
jgi:hypothetical protein